MSAARKTKVYRKASDISTKVWVPAVISAASAIVLAAATNSWDAEAIGLSVGAAVTAVVGYFTTDRVE